MEELTKDQKQQILLSEVKLLKQERPLFEDNYVKQGGRLQYLKWSECSDGTGSYEVDWESLEKDEITDQQFENHIQEHAEHVNGCLHSWVECAKSKAIPVGYYLMPLQPCIEMLNKAELEFEGFDIPDLQDRIVFSHQAMIQAMLQKEA